jgi:hypothetical protein
MEHATETTLTVSAAIASLQREVDQLRQQLVAAEDKHRSLARTLQQRTAYGAAPCDPDSDLPIATFTHGDIVQMQQGVYDWDDLAVNLIEYTTSEYEVEITATVVMRFAVSATSEEHARERVATGCVEVPEYGVDLDSVDDVQVTDVYGG